MPSPTVNKGYTYPAHGGGVGTWDTNLNGNIEYQDLNLGGYYPITATSTTAAVTFNSSYATIPSTCQSITFAASLAQNLFYYVSGALTSSLAINMPAVGSVYVFGNAVSSGAIGVGPTAGTQQTLSPGQAVIVTTSTGAVFGQNAFGAISVGGAITGADGSAAAPEYAFTNDPDCGMYRTGTNSLGIAANGAQVVAVSSAGISVTGSVVASSGLTVSAGTVSLPAASVADAALATPPGRVLLATLTGSGGATLSDTTHITGAYPHYELVFENVVPSTNNVEARLQVHSGGVFPATLYRYAGNANDVAGSGNIASFPQTYISLSAGYSRISNVASDGGISGTMLFYNPSQTASVKAITGHMAVPMATTNAGLQFIFNAVWTGGNGAIDGFQFQFSAGNITSGTIKIYGLV